MLNIRSFPPLVDMLFNKHHMLVDRCWYGFITALLIGLCIGKSVIFSLTELSIKQVFRTQSQVRDLAILHHSKAGVPTMGGVIVLIASLASVLIWASFNDLVVIALLVYLACTFIGWLDDFLKIRRNNSKGLSGWFKLLMQAAVTFMVIYLAYQDPPLKNLLMRVDWQILERFSPSTVFYLTVLFYFFVIAGTTNAVNITDGIDGLAISNILLCFLFFSVVGFFSCDMQIAHPNWLLTYSGGASELAVLCACFAGGSAAFLVFNHHPASVFMGDTGSIGLGGLVAIVAILLRQPFMLCLVGLVFVIEVLSDVIQVTSKKLFKRRVFLIAPLHHHFELKGFAEQKIVNTVFVIQFLLVLFALYVIFYREVQFAW